MGTFRVALGRSRNHPMDDYDAIVGFEDSGRFGIISVT